MSPAQTELDTESGGTTAERLRVATDLAEVQRIVRTSARRLAHADGATFVLRDVDHCFYADEDAISPLWKGQRFPITHCISGWAMLHAESVVIPDITADGRIPIESYRPTFVKSLAMVPIGGEKPVAAIGAYWARRHTATPQELAALEDLAAAAGRAIKRIGLFGAASLPALSGAPGAEAPDPVDRVPQNLVVSEDHERIARDLHDTVLQRMFAAGLRMQAIGATAGDSATAAAVEEVVAQIDDTIRELRGVIFGLEYGHERLGGMAADILAVAAETARALGFRPDVTIDESLDPADDSLRHEVVSALREMLSNVSRHAGASEVKVVCTGGESIRLQVTDNGVGLPDDLAGGNGLANLRARAESLGGSFKLASADGDGHGAVAIWSVPAR